MFRYTATMLVIFMVLNHDFAASRRLDYFGPRLIRRENEESFKNDVKIHKREALNEVKVKETEVAAADSRQKRSAGSLFRAGLSLGSGAAFAFSTSLTIYHAIRKCKDYKPQDCSLKPTCHYISCPDVCHGPETNRNYVEAERERLKTKLDNMDIIQRDAFNLATQAISAGINNKKILVEIDRINQKVDQLIYSIASLDINFATGLRNKSVFIGGLIRNEKLNLDDIVASQEIEGIFDKWTWEGTGVFVLSIALPLSLTLFSQFRQRLKINEIYKNLKTDFNNKFVNQKTSRFNPNAKIHNRFAYVQGVSTKTINKDLKATAKAIFYSDRAYTQVSKIERITNNYITPLVNAIVIALSVWTSYQQISNCIAVANDMQDTAIKMANQADKVEKMKVTLVDPLLKNVTTQAWPKVRAMMTNEETLDWLDGIRNLTLGAAKPNMTTADTIQNFIDNIAGSNYANFLKMQDYLYEALKSVEFDYTCLADKQHAITTVVTDCRIGRQPFPQLYQYALSKHKLNVPSCIAKGVMPYTSEAQFFEILSKTATHQGWYSNCLLNSEDLLYRVCSEKLKGYTTPKLILNQVNKTELTESMVINFLGRCPPPKITPASIRTTCDLYCLLQPVDKIAKTAALLESQVIQVQRTCPICDVKARDLKKICNMFYCASKNKTTIMNDVELPLPTVESVIAKNCSGKCIIDDTATKKSICDDYKCKGFTATAIAKSLSVPEQAVNDVIPNCDTILPQCVVSVEDKNKVLSLHCNLGASAMMIHSFGFVDLPLATINAIIAGTTCAEYKAG